jgi:hypothetical protein
MGADPHLPQELQGGVSVRAPHALHIGQQHHAPARMQDETQPHKLPSVVIHAMQPSQPVWHQAKLMYKLRLLQVCI